MWSHFLYVPSHLTHSQSDMKTMYALASLQCSNALNTTNEYITIYNYRANDAGFSSGGEVAVILTVAENLLENQNIL